MHGKYVNFMVIGCESNKVGATGLKPITRNLMMEMAMTKGGFSLPYSEEDMQVRFAYISMVDPLHTDRAVTDLLPGYSLHGEDFGTFSLFAFREDKHIVPASALTAEIERILTAKYEANGKHRQKLSREDKKDLKREAEMRLLPKFPVKSKVVHAVLDHNSGRLYLLTASTTLVENVLQYMQNYLLTRDGDRLEDTFRILSIWSQAAEIAGCGGVGFEPGATHESLTSEFLTWLWFLEETRFAVGKPGFDLAQMGMPTMVTQTEGFGKVRRFDENGNADEAWASTEGDLGALRYVMWRENALLSESTFAIYLQQAGSDHADSFTGRVKMSSQHYCAMQTRVPDVLRPATIEKELAWALRNDPELTREQLNVCVKQMLWLHRAALCLMAAFLQRTRTLETSPRRWANTLTYIKQWLEAYVPECERGDGVQPEELPESDNVTEA